MRRRILIIALALGTVLGFGAGFARLATCHRRADSTPEFLGSHRGGAGWGGFRDERREAFERHVADVCTDAALRARALNQAAPPGP